MNLRFIPWRHKRTLLPKVNRILFLVTLLLGCTGPIHHSTPHPVQVRIASGPPLAGDLEPDERNLKPAQGAFYYVRPGDTLWAIATAHNLDVEKLAAWNQITKPDQLLVGQRLRVKPSPYAPKPTAAHPVFDPPDITQPDQQSTEQQNDSASTPEHPNLEAPRITPLSRKNLTTSPAPTTQNEEEEEENQTNTPRRIPPPKPAKTLSTQAPGQWTWPHKGRIIARFGQFGARHNPGIDIAAKPGDPVQAAADGVVAYADQGVTGYGNMILLRHGGSFMTAYAHIDKILVKRGQHVRSGDTIALSGQTGITTSPRLHFEIRHSITPVNPLKYLPRKW